MLLHGRVLREVGKITSKDGIFPNAVPGSAVEAMHASTEALVLAGDMAMVRALHDGDSRGGRVCFPSGWARH